MAFSPSYAEIDSVGVGLVFAVVYLGMFLGGLPKLKLDRTGVAVLGAIAMIALTGMSLEEAARSVHLPTIVLLFAFMVLSAQMRLGGFYGAIARRVGGWPLSRAAWLAALISMSAMLSAVFSNDVVCLAMTPVVARLCLRRGMDPVPSLIGLACAANIGSAATLIGNPQNMLIGSVLSLQFGGYLRVAALPVLASLALLWGWLVWGPGARHASPAGSANTGPAVEQTEPFDTWQSVKGLSVAVVLMGVFLFTGWDRDVAALVGAGVLLLSRRFHSADVMGQVDWPLLLLFIGLFVVNHAMARTGMANEAVAWLAAHGVHLDAPGTLLVVGTLLSNLVSNVPAVMLLLPHLGADPQSAGLRLALVSTVAGNLLLVGSIANLIVADLAAREGIAIDWKRHIRTGLPVTLMSLVMVWWLA